MTTAAFSRHRSKLHHHPAAHVLNGTPLWLPLNFGKSQKFSDRFCKVPSFTADFVRNGLSLHAEAVAIVEQIEDGDVEAGPDPLDPYNVGRCLIGFLHYFSTTNLHNIVIAPARECPIFRVSSMARSAAVLQDPLDIKNDILRGSFNLHRVQELWWFSLHALSSYVPGLIPSILSTFINPRGFSFVSRFSVAVDPTAEPDERGN